MKSQIIKDRLYSQQEIIDMIGETLLAPEAYSLGLLAVDSPFIMPILEAFPGTYLHLYYHKDAGIGARSQEVLSSGRVELICVEDGFPKYLTRMSRFQSFYDYAVVGELGKPVGKLQNVWPRINIGGIIALYGSDIRKNKIGLEIRYKTRWVVVMGCCRGATEYGSAVIGKTRQVALRHQHYGLDGIIGGEATGLVVPQGTILIHQVRAPLGVITSSSMRARKLSPYCGPLIGYSLNQGGAKGRLLWAMNYWYHWNRLADRNAHFTYRVENLENVWDAFCFHLGIDGCNYPEVPSNKNSDKAKPTYPHITWDTLYALDSGLTDKTKVLASKYGYTIDP